MNKDAVILIPCYDPNEKIMKSFLSELTKEFKNIVFVDDGCNKKHDKYMKELAKDFPVVKHNVNLGKGRGLKNGYNYILNNYPKAKVIIAADCDGQHSVKDIKKCYEVALKNMDSIVLGVRDFDKANVPLKSQYGNKLTRNILYFFVGKKISDTQTGLRAMSLNVARRLIEIPGERYEYETNVLIASKGFKIPIKEVIIDTIYINDNATSHFNPVKDSMRIYKFFMSYILVTFFAWILETLFFAGCYDLVDALYSAPLFLFACKLLSSLIILLINKHINLLYTILNFITVIVIAVFFPKHIILLKVLIDLIKFIGSLFLINFKTKKEA